MSEGMRKHWALLLLYVAMHSFSQPAL